MPTPPTDPWLGTTTPVPTQRGAITVTVSRYTPTATPTVQLLDNLECLDVEESIGAAPPRARFRYRFTGQDPDAPQSIQEALDYSFNKPKTVNVNDRLVVQATRPDGTREFLFDGFALGFGLDLDAEAEDADIVAIGVAKVCYDAPIPGMLIRDGSDVTGGADVQTDIPAQFNPKGVANATPAGSEANADPTGATDEKYPTFLDPAVGGPSPKARAWTLPMAARHLIFKCGLDGLAPAGSPVMTFPTGPAIDSLLVARIPIPGQNFSPSDPTTYTTSDLQVSDRPITGRDWPGVLNELVRDKGYGMAWTVSGTTTPTTNLSLFQLQGAPPKDVYLQARGSYLDPNLTNVARAHVDRDTNQVVNKWQVMGGLRRYEVSFILAPGFPMHSADATSATAIAAFDSTSAGFSGNIDAYRLFLFDECDAGHYVAGSSTRVAGTAGSLDAVLGGPDDAGNPTHATMRRRPIGRCISTGADGDPYPATLAISTNYGGASPRVWDRSATWQTVQGGWELLDDQIGIRITAANPNAWKIGKSQDSSAPFPSGVVKVVESLAPPIPASANPRFWLRLTCVIEGDSALIGTADRSPSSALPGTVARIIDARDRYKRLTVHSSSEHNDGGDSIDTRDDTAAATAEATAARQATEAGVLEGEITIPRLTRYYKIGDRIRQIAGRGLGLRTDSGATTNANDPVYPVVVGIRHVLAGRQETTLRLSDQDGHRFKGRGKVRRPARHPRRGRA